MQTHLIQQITYQKVKRSNINIVLCRNVNSLQFLSSWRCSVSCWIGAWAPRAEECSGLTITNTNRLEMRNWTRKFRDRNLLVNYQHSSLLWCTSFCACTAGTWRTSFARTSSCRGLYNTINRQCNSQTRNILAFDWFNRKCKVKNGENCK